MNSGQSYKIRSVISCKSNEITLRFQFGFFRLLLETGAEIKPKMGKEERGFDLKGKAERRTD